MRDQYLTDETRSFGVQPESDGRVVVATVDRDRGRITIAHGTSDEPAPTAGSGVLAPIEVVGRTKGRVSPPIIEGILAADSDPPRTYLHMCSETRTGGKRWRDGR